MTKEELIEEIKLELGSPQIVIRTTNEVIESMLNVVLRLVSKYLPKIKYATVSLVGNEAVLPANVLTVFGVYRTVNTLRTEGTIVNKFENAIYGGKYLTNTDDIVYEFIELSNIESMAKLLGTELAYTYMNKKLYVNDIEDETKVTVEYGEILDVNNLDEYSSEYEFIYHLLLAKLKQREGMLKTSYQMNTLTTNGQELLQQGKEEEIEWTRKLQEESNLSVFNIQVG